MKAIEWDGKSVKSEKFLEFIKHWTENDNEVLVEFYFSRSGGVTKYGLVNSVEAFKTLCEKTIRSCEVTIYRKSDFSVRGYIDEIFAKHVLQKTNDGESWFLLVYPDEGIEGFAINSYGDSKLTMLREEMSDYMGKYMLFAPIDYWSFPPDDLPGEWIRGNLDVNLENESNM